MSRYGDASFRQMMTPRQAELLTEYCRCTKRIVTLNYMRLEALSILEQRDISVDDVFTVIKYVKRLIRTGENRRKVGTFTPASLEFGNLFGDYAKFEDRLQTAREELIAKRVRKNKMVAATHQLPDGDSITRLEPQTDNRAPADTRLLVAAALREIADSLI
jgi:hypothetical protein